jgi:hypothetical protein
MRNEEKDLKDFRGIQKYKINGHPLTNKRVIVFLLGAAVAITGIVLTIAQDNIAYLLLLYLGWLFTEVAWDNFIKQKHKPSNQNSSNGTE